MAEPWELDWDGVAIDETPPAPKEGTKDAAVTAKVRADAIAQYKASVALGKQIERFRELYAKGPGATKGLKGIMDFLPTEANQTFNSFSDQFRGPVKAALGMTGGENNTAAEGQQNLGGYLARASDFDGNIEEKINALEDMRLRSAEEAIAVLGGIPDANGNVTPIQQGQNPLNPTGGIQRSTAVGAQFEGGAQRGAIATGASKDIQIPPEMQAEFTAFLQANPRGKLSPEAYAEKRLELNQKYGFGLNPGDLQTYLSEGKAYNENLNRPFNMSIPATKGSTTQAERDKGAMFTNPFGGAQVAGAANFANAMGAGIPKGLEPQAFDAIRQAQPATSAVGDVAGTVAGIGGASKGLVASGLVRDLPKALFRTNLGYGTVRGATEMPENPTAGAGIGFLTALAGEGIGRGAVAPVANAALRSQTGQRVGNVARGIFGRRQVPIVEPLSTPEQMIVSAVGDRGPQTMGNLREASRLGLPFTLADANPNLRALAGSAVRKSPEVRQLAEDTLRPRAMGQIDRLQGAISRDFGDPVSILQKSDELINQARTASKPYYESAFAAPGASSVNVEDILDTPLGKQALERARTQAMNDRMDPTALGFDLNDQAETVLTRVPSFKTLDYIKRAFDDIANEGKTAFGTFQPNEAQATAARLASDLRGRVDQINPDYAKAREAFAGPAGEREALNMGKKALGQSADAVKYTLGNLSGNKPQQYRLGALSALSERANNINYSRNPYDAVAGSPEARARLGVLFPDKAWRFNRQADLEGEMSRTFTEALGGSPTQPRAMADEAFDAGPGMALALDAGSAMVAGAPPVATLSRLGGNFLKDNYRLGLGQKKAAEIGPVLLNPDAAQAAAIFRDIREKGVKAGMLGRKTKKQAKTVGDITASFSAPLTSYLLSQ